MAGPSTSSISVDKARYAQPPPDPQNTNNQPLKPSRQESSDNLKGFKVTLDDPTWKVLPAALKKYRINNDSWQNYAMFICYGSPGTYLYCPRLRQLTQALIIGNRIERCLSYDEKPLLLFQKLKDAKKNPVFMLKHIKDIRSPIAVAQQKHAARKASSVISNDTTATTATQGHHKNPSTSRAANRPPRLEVQDLSASAPLPSNTLSPQPGWPEPGLSPAVDTQRNDETSLIPASAGTQSTHMSGSTLVGTNGHDPSKHKANGVHIESPPTGTLSAGIPAANGVSYAVAIYPYMAEQDDEFDVVV